MTMRNLPLNTWMVIRQRSSWKEVAMISKHNTQDAAEAERDRRNMGATHRPYRVCMVLEPIAQRMGGQLAPTARTPRRGDLPPR